MCVTPLTELTPLLSDNAIARLVMLACQARPEDARAYLGTMLTRTTPCERIRNFLEERGLSASAMAMLDESLPWLAGSTLGDAAGEPRDVRAMLEVAKGAGVARRDLTPSEYAEVERDVAEFDQPTGGRPRKMVRLRAYDPRHNPFAQPA